MNSLYKFIFSRWAWILLSVSAIALNLTALFFQHVMKLDPCLNCIYERVAMYGIVFAGIFGVLSPRLLLTRTAGFGLWGYCAWRGLEIARQHVEAQFPTNPFAGSCGLFTNFPSWAPLDQWFPAVFMPTGECSKISWVFLDLTMAQWLVVIFTIYLVVLTTVVALQLAKPILHRPLEYIR